MEAVVEAGEHLDGARIRPELLKPSQQGSGNTEPTLVQLGQQPQSVRKEGTRLRSVLSEYVVRISPTIAPAATWCHREGTGVRG